MSAKARAIRIAILAMGGEGGGVLAQWIVDLAEHHDHVAQMTSVPGVAQRTGATVYYVELFPKSAIVPGRPPVLALMPVPGDVDIVLSSELMEAGRAIQRGFVTPDRTLLITATHRVFAMTERIALGDGRVDSAALREACEKASRRLVALDLAAIAQRTGSVISAALFGALARSGELPFTRENFEAQIRRGGVGVEPSLRAFSAAYEAADAKAPESAAPPPPGLDSQDTDAASAPVVPSAAPPSGVAALQLAADGFPAPLREIVRTGIARAADFQDLSYARLYLARLGPILAIERSGDGDPFPLTGEVARYLALGMCFEDTIRVADLKIRRERFSRVRQEVGAKPDQLVEIAEFLHPRLQEIAESLPARLGRFITENALARKLVESLTAKGKIVRTTSLRGFLTLFAVASLKPWRRSSARYLAEQASLEDWLSRIAALAPDNPALALELAECRNLVRGYGDTHARGSANYATILAQLPALAGRSDGAEVLAALRKAALADETGAALARAIAERLPPQPRLAAE